MEPLINAASEVLTYTNIRKRDGVNMEELYRKWYLEERKLKLVLHGNTADDINQVVLDYLASLQRYVAGEIAPEEIEKARRDASALVKKRINSPL